MSYVGDLSSDDQRLPAPDPRDDRERASMLHSLVQAGVLTSGERKAYMRRRSLRARQRRSAFLGGAILSAVVVSAAWLLVSYQGAALVNRLLEALGI